ncbi:hypothetical protein ACJMK2_014161 [Sinanodonta woodiana]|uniref:Zinc finger PHD-type domain-containing protein n=1 Tax=Sinanodonta woodiana TaxID=1069815 RepID=A0ABD3V1T6_SINWO
MIEILESYKEYIPKNDDGDPLSLLVYCDGFSCERVEGAQRARINGADRWTRLDLFEPAIQEWHRCFLHQDTYDELFKFESHREKGTLYNLKQVYDHRGVTKNVMDCFDKAEALLEFVTEGYIILYAMELSGMTLSKRIVDKLYEKVNTKEVINVAIEPVIDGGEYCICQLDAGGPMVYCNNQYCQRGSWFHLECLGMEEDDAPEDESFCSEESRMEHELRLSCRKKTTADRFKDSKHEYVKRLIRRGLNDIARHDAVKENDGPRMIRYWKFDLFEFYEKNHPKYLIYGLRLIANIAGATSERLKHALIWERTVNLKGGKIKNIPKDLHCEHLNREYTESSRNAGGQLTTDTINRHSQMLGVGKAIYHLFDENVICRPFNNRKTGKINRKKDILRMVQTLKSQNLVRYQSGRVFKGFEDLKVVSGVKFPQKFKERLMKHVDNMAKLRELKS